MIRRLDHIIICARDRDKWAGRIERVLGLRPNRGRSGDEWGFDNWEFDIGDGFLGVVTPSSPESQLERFLQRRGEAFYAVSVDIGSLTAGKDRFKKSGVPFRTATRNEVPTLLWPSPPATAGVLFQVHGGVEAVQGTNPNLQGLKRVVLVADDLDLRTAQLQHSFALADPEQGEDSELAARTRTFDLPGSPLGHQIVIASPLEAGPLATRLEHAGPSIFEWGIATSDFDSELSRLQALGVGTSMADSPSGATALIDPDQIGGLRLRLHST